MFTERSSARGGPGRLVVLTLLACASWLLLQNSLLLIWLSSQHLEPLIVVTRVLVRVGWHFAADFWMLAAVVVLGVALALSGVERGAEPRAGVFHVG